MVKKSYPEAVKRLFHNMFVCRVCKHKMRADSAKVRLGKIKCRHCNSRALRLKKKPVM